MATAKEIFLNRLSTLETALTSHDLISKSLTERSHNEKARLLRNGLAIIEFNILEDFIKKRLGEILKEIGRYTISFDRLPAKLKEACVVGALKGIQERSVNLKRDSEDYILFLQTETGFVASTKNSVFELSEYSLGWDKSNINHDDIPNFLKTFNINSGWDAIKSISIMIGVTLADPKFIFLNAQQRRHKAAHNPEADSLLSDLKDFVLQSKVIALSFDLLLSKSLKYIKDCNEEFLTERIKTEANHIKFRYIVKVHHLWKEYKSLSNRAYRTNDNYEILFNEAKIRAQNASEVLLVKTDSNEVKNWYITEL